jgi:hypothetical protein
MHVETWFAVLMCHRRTHKQKEVLQHILKFKSDDIIMLFGDRVSLQTCTNVALERSIYGHPGKIILLAEQCSK